MTEILKKVISTKIIRVVDCGHRFNLYYDNNLVQSYTKNDIIRIVDKYAEEAN